MVSGHRLILTGVVFSVIHVVCFVLNAVGVRVFYIFLASVFRINNYKAVK